MLLVPGISASQEESVAQSQYPGTGQGGREGSLTAPAVPTRTKVVSPPLPCSQTCSVDVTSSLSDEVTWVSGRSPRSCSVLEMVCPYLHLELKSFSTDKILSTSLSFP